MIRACMFFTMKDIDRSGIASVMEQALALAGKGTGGIHVSFDLDVCDPTIAPGVGTPVKAGSTTVRLTWSWSDRRSGLLRALDLVEVNPILDDRNNTAVLVCGTRRLRPGQKIISSPCASPASHRDGRGAPEARRDDREYSAYLGRSNAAAGMHRPSNAEDCTTGCSRRRPPSEALSLLARRRPARR